VIAFGASLLAVVANMVGVYVHTPAWEISGVAGLPLGILLIAIAAFLFWYARRAAARGWIG
jgi:F0F1-type ATP synthase assembly protein I